MRCRPGRESGGPVRPRTVRGVPASRGSLLLTARERCACVAAGWWVISSLLAGRGPVRCSSGAGWACGLRGRRPGRRWRRASRGCDGRGSAGAAVASVPRVPRRWCVPRRSARTGVGAPPARRTSRPVVLGAWCFGLRGGACTWSGKPSAGPRWPSSTIAATCGGVRSCSAMPSVRGAAWSCIRPGRSDAGHGRRPEPSLTVVVLAVFRFSPTRAATVMSWSGHHCRVLTRYSAAPSSRVRW